MPNACGTDGHDCTVAEGFDHGFEKPVYSCIHCEQPFPTISAYRDHKFLELTDRRCACTKCGEIFRWSENKGDNSSYHDHKRRHGSLNHRCPHCKVCFVSAEVLQDHLEGNLGDVPFGVFDMGCRFACAQCPQTFVSCETRCNHTHPEIQPFYQAVNVVLDRCAIPRQGNNTFIVPSPYSKSPSRAKLASADDCGHKLVKRETESVLSEISLPAKPQHTNDLSNPPVKSSSPVYKSNLDAKDSDKILPEALTLASMPSYQVVPLNTSAKGIIWCNSRDSSTDESSLQPRKYAGLSNEFLLLNTVPVFTVCRRPVFDFDREMSPPSSSYSAIEGDVNSAKMALATVTCTKNKRGDEGEHDLCTEEVAGDVPADNTQSALGMLKSCAFSDNPVQTSPNPNNTRAASFNMMSSPSQVLPARGKRNATVAHSFPLPREKTSVSVYRPPVTEESPPAHRLSYNGEMSTAAGNLRLTNERKPTTACVETLTTQRKASPTRSSCSVEVSSRSAGSPTSTAYRQPETVPMSPGSIQRDSPAPNTPLLSCENKSAATPSQPSCNERGSTLAISPSSPSLSREPLTFSPRSTVSNSPSRSSIANKPLTSSPKSTVSHGSLLSIVTSEFRSSSPKSPYVHAKSRLEDCKLAVLRCKLSIADQRLTLPTSNLPTKALHSWLAALEGRLKAAEDCLMGGDTTLPLSEVFPGGCGNQSDKVVVLGDVDLKFFANPGRYAEEWLMYAEKMLG